MRDIDGLPGGEMVAAGLRDLSAGVESIPSLLVSIGASRLRRLDIAVPRAAGNPEHGLYRLLLDQHGDAAHGGTTRSCAAWSASSARLKCGA